MIKPDSAEARALALQAKIREHRKDELAKPVEQRRNFNPIQIPLWDNSAYAVQHDISRSALFSSKGRGARKYIADEAIPSLSHLRILFRGEELRQGDMDVYLEGLSFGRGQMITSQDPWTRFNARKMIRELGWTDNNESVKRLHQTISRLIACNIQVTRKEIILDPATKKERSIERVYGYGGLFERMAGIINGEITSSIDGTLDWAIIINTELASQIKPGLYTKIDKNIRKKLSSLGKWLQNYYASHKKPYPIKVETLRTLSGSSSFKLFQFRYVLRQELEMLKSLDFLAEYSISNEDLVSVVKGKNFGEVADIDQKDLET